MNTFGQQGGAQDRRTAAVVRRATSTAESTQANRGHWDSDASHYLATYGSVLGTAEFVWGPEGLLESEANLLGDVTGLRVLELGCGAAQCARWLRLRGAHVIGLDISAGMLAESARLDADSGVAVPVAQADAHALPLATNSVDLVVSSFGALPFAEDSARVVAEIARVLVRDGRFALSLVHPIRWVFPDDPDPASLRVVNGYFDRTPYVEEDNAGHALYVEHHRTLGDRIRELRAAGLVLDDLIEPEWSRDDTRPWGAWSPARSALIPGTMILLGHSAA